MKPEFLNNGALRAAALGVLALVVGAFATPSSAEAAYLKDVDLGNISVKTDSWDPAQRYVSFNLKFNEGGYQRVSGDYTTSGGKKQWVDSLARGDQFTVNYRFSLYDKASLKFTGGLIDDGRINSRNVTLTGPDGKVVYSGLSARAPLLENLQGGDYVLSLSGPTSPAYSQYYYFSMQTDGGVPPSPNPGDVPLPGALVLLGTALAGAGVWARRRAEKGKPAV